jgi:amidophosphoribosyltransferase
MGLVSKVFRKWDSKHLKGKVGIGHVRYSTTGSSVLINAQPMIVNTKRGKIAIAHNGNIINYLDLKKKLQKLGYTIRSTSDTELVAYLIDHELKNNAFENALKKAFSQLVGSYSFVILTDKEELIAVRDPLGFKPLCLGKKGKNSYISSESCSFYVLDVKLVRDVKPGEILIFKNGDMKSLRMKGTKEAHCMFEYVYFARPDSDIDGANVHDVRTRIGQVLAEEHPVRADVVIPVPDCSRTAAVALAIRLKIPSDEGLLKNRYVGRTFIMPSQAEREKAVRIKMAPLNKVIKGRKVIVVDDSIVRGTTTRKIVQMLRDAGAKEIHLRVGCPPLKAPCYYGIDMATYGELIASKNKVEKIRKITGADSLGYISVDGLVKAIGLPRNKLCLGCLVNEYPTKVDPRYCERRECERDHHEL